MVVLFCSQGKRKKRKRDNGKCDSAEGEIYSMDRFTFHVPTSDPLASFSKKPVSLTTGELKSGPFTFRFVFVSTNRVAPDGDL